jgi:lipooligosaccharide transport system ATP-binding protein
MLDPLDDAPQPGAAIKLRGVVKRFGSLTAIDGLDLDVPFGSCTGLLGPNGAGKSTLLKALTAQVIADEGELEVLGFRLPGASKEARASMGVVPQQDNLDVALTVEQNLLVFAHLYRIPARRRADAIERALRITNLLHRRASKVEQLSGGMRRRLLIARALLHAPRLILLDEPTVGLDPQVRQDLWALIDMLRASGVSILMSTHYIEEAERLCDTVTIMTHGRLVVVGPPQELIRRHAGAEAIEVFGSSARLSEIERHACERGWRTRRTGTSVSVLHADGAVELDGARRVTSLEDVFVLLTGEEIE